MKQSKEYQQNYYQRKVKPERERKRKETLAQLGVPQHSPQARTNYARKYGNDRRMFHLSFSGELREFIEEQSHEIGFQAFFDRLVEEKRLLENDKN